MSYSAVPGTRFTGTIIGNWPGPGTSTLYQYQVPGQVPVCVINTLKHWETENLEPVRCLECMNMAFVRFLYVCYPGNLITEELKQLQYFASKWNSVLQLHFFSCREPKKKVVDFYYVRSTSSNNISRFLKVQTVNN